MARDVIAAGWPLRFLVDARQASIGWALVNAEIVSPGRHSQVAMLRRAGFRFIGMSSDMDFPRTARPGPIDYAALCEAWCHCFRSPELYLPPETPRALISESDFTDWRHVSAQVAAEAAPEAEPFDFIYVAATEPWKMEAKNWPLARTCIPRICAEFGLRCLVVGAAPGDRLPAPSVSYVDRLPWRQFIARLAGARFLFLPNILDASPRVLAEALCLDVPAVVHRRITGGWKYINAFTGAFFDGEEDVVDAVRRCLGAATQARRWFRANYGPYLAGRRLLALVRRLDPSVQERSHLLLTERIDAAELHAP